MYFLLLSLLCYKPMEKMENSDMPLFSNTCGKLFYDSIIFASSKNEIVIPLQDIRKITFKKSFLWSSLFILVLPIAVFALGRFFVSDDDTFVKGFLYTIAVIFSVICLLKAEKKYTLKVKQNTRAILTIRVSGHNVNDAQKFVDKAGSLLKQHQSELKKRVADANKTEVAFANSISNIVHH